MFKFISNNRNVDGGYSENYYNFLDGYRFEF